MMEKIASGEYRRDMTTDRKPPPSRTADQFVLRLPSGMREHIAALAKHNGRSMNAEIIARLDDSLKEQGEGLDMLAAIKTKIDEIGNFLIAEEERRPKGERKYTPEQMQALREELAAPTREVPRYKKKP